jgi:hypothetical protein
MVRQSEKEFLFLQLSFDTAPVVLRLLLANDMRYSRETSISPPNLLEVARKEALNELRHSCVAANRKRDDEKG